LILNGRLTWSVAVAEVYPAADGLEVEENGNIMLVKTKIFVSCLTLLFLPRLLTCRAEDTFAVRSLSKQVWEPAEARKLYFSACLVLREEYGHDISPEAVLVLGAEKDVVDFHRHEIRLVKWDRKLFAEGVVLLGFDQLMTREKSLIFANRAVDWADSRVEAGELRQNDTRVEIPQTSPANSFTGADH
jgi:hypothetical protein